MHDVLATLSGALVGLSLGLIGGGIAGGFLGMRLALHFSKQRATLNRIFAGLIFVVAAYMLYRNAASLGGL